MFWRRRSQTRIDSLIQDADNLRDSLDFPGASEAYAAVLLHAPDRFDIRVQYGNMLKDCGRFTEAEAAYRAALAIHPGHADAYVQLGHLLKITDRRLEARAAYRDALAADPDNRSAKLELLHMGDTSSLGPQREQINGKVLSELGYLAQRLVEVQATLNDIKQALPDNLGLKAFSINQWAALRRMYSVPRPPQLHKASQALHVVVDATEDEEEETYARIASLCDQAPTPFTAAVIATPRTSQSVERYTQGNARWKVVKTLKEAVHDAPDLVVLSASGDRLAPHALSWLHYAMIVTGAHAASCDSELLERTTSEDTPTSVILRGPPDPDSLLEADLLGSTLAVMSKYVQALAQEDMNLSTANAIRALGLNLSKSFRIAHVPLPLVENLRATALPRVDYSDLVRHLLNKHGRGEDPSEQGSTSAALQLGLQNDRSISVIIPTLAEDRSIAEMVASLRNTAAHPNTLEIIVIDNGSRSPIGKDLLEEMRACGKAKVVRIDKPFNWAYLNNCAAAHATSDILVFANDDMEMLSPAWDDRLRMQLSRRHVGAVGAKLLYPHGTIQHAGVLVGWPESVIHDGLDAEANDDGPNLRYSVTRRVAAVTGAFLGVRRADFDSINGFDSTRYAISYSDIDFCFRLRERGLSILWVPQIELIHHESKTRKHDSSNPERQKRHEAEHRVFAARWRQELRNDASTSPFWLNFGRPMRLVLPPSLDRVLTFIGKTGLGKDYYYIAPAPDRTDPYQSA